MLCVFSYIAAGQEQNKGFSAQKLTEHHRQTVADSLTPQSSTFKFQSFFFWSLIDTKIIMCLGSQLAHQASGKVPIKTIESHGKPQIMNVQPQKPATTISAVQPQSNTTQNSIAQSISNATSAILQRNSSINSKTTSPAEKSRDELPQIPPRIQAQSSVTSTTRGPPPAIPPRSTKTAPNRSSSVQVATSTPQSRPTLARQTSANSIPPQCTRQPAPKFVIPQRQNSRTSLNRSGSISGPSSND